MIRKITLLIFFAILSLSTQAKHIIGGEVTYVCLGNDVYEFTMRIYRDCQDPTAGGFDNPARIAIYQGNYAPYMQLGQTQQVDVTGEIVNLDPQGVDPCLEVPPGLCSQQGTYVFQLTLPQGPESYHIVYQRCCRNNTITNIVDPQLSGASYSVEVTPAAQAVCNNSPVYNQFPPIVICAGEPLMVDHSATDPDGIDQLVYELCSPLLGGGPDGSSLSPGNANSCTGVVPNPPCAPPFAPVNFALPTYSALNPLGGDVPITIDPVTGIITGTPSILGQFVVGICVKEYRNGELLSTISRDFQFNVSTCDPTVEAGLEADAQIGAQEFTLASCGNQTIGFINESVQQEFIDSYFWTFEMGNGVLDTVYEWDPLVTFPDTGFYNGTLVLNPDSDCSDTAYVAVQIYPDVEPDFIYEYDTCIAGPVLFEDISVAGVTPMVEWEWRFGDGTTSNDEKPIHEYLEPGNKDITLVVIDENTCQDSITKSIVYYPVPPLVIFEPSSSVGCPPLPITLTNLSVPIDTTYDIRWTFEEGGDTIVAFSPSYLYEQPGTYTIKVDITSPIGCYTSEVFRDWIDVDSLPVADFDFYQTEGQPISNFNPTVQFEDKSRRVVNWDWTFDEHGTTILQNPTFTFRDTGLQVIELIVTHPYGCYDTTSQVIDVVPMITFYMPNAFTPNSDGLNEEFMASGYMVGLDDYQIQIWDRNGGLIFQSTDPTEGWNGRRRNGHSAQAGVYVYQLSYKGPRGIPYEIKGFATLVR